MSYINVFVSKNAKIYIKNNQLCLENGENKATFPIEDVNSVMIENLNTLISTYTLSIFAENGILSFICNQNHLPNGGFCHFVNIIKPFHNIIIKKMYQNHCKNNYGKR